jgi:uncharacterized protein Yka (UPF0111/DUF47 family)
MRRHLEKVVECAQMLQPLFEAVLDGSTEDVQRTADLIDRLEDDADLVKNELRDHLPRSTFLPNSSQNRYWDMIDFSWATTRSRNHALS